MYGIREVLSWLYSRIWDLALPYQDKRNDGGHTEIATRYAIELIVKLISEVDSTIVIPEIVIPAIILHDIGWSQMSYERRMISYNPSSNKDLARIVRLEHQVYGVQLAGEILKQTDYDPNLVGDILTIISQHDTRQGFYTLEDAVVRDADKLWRYTQRHLEVSIANKNWTTKKEAAGLIEHVRNRIDEPGFFMTGQAKEIARRDIKKLVIPENLK